MPEAVVYRPADRPDVEVLIGGTWYPGELRMWSPRPEWREVVDHRCLLRGERVVIAVGTVALSFQTAEHPGLVLP
jgi:hypothetical protein